MGIFSNIFSRRPTQEMKPDVTPERAAQVRAEFQARLKQIKQEADIRQAERNGRGGSRQSKNY
jgi:hypothetical protein